LQIAEKSLHDVHSMKQLKSIYKLLAGGCLRVDEYLVELV
jgi:hypothetical protein